MYLCTPFHYVIYVAQIRSNSKEGIYISAYPFHLQQTVNKPKELQQQQEASITDPSCGSSHVAHDSEASSGAAFCYSGLFSCCPEGASTWCGWRQASFPNCDGTRMWSRMGPVLLFSQLKFLLEVNAAIRSKMLILREWWAQLLLHKSLRFLKHSRSIIYSELSELSLGLKQPFLIKINHLQLSNILCHITLLSKY